MTIQKVLLSAALLPPLAVETFSERYENYAEAYRKNPAVCGKEKLLLFQSAYYFSEVLNIKVEGISITLFLASGQKIHYPTV